MPLFKAEQFVATQHATAEQKARFANQFVRFVESDFDRTKFTKWFYTRLSMCFGHIAHFNQSGFYGTFFRRTSAIRDFLMITVEARYSYNSDPTYTYCDVEIALAKWVKEQKLVEKYEAKLAAEIEAGERMMLAKLKAKYEG